MLDRIDNYAERARFFEKFISRPDLLEQLELSPDYLSVDRPIMWTIAARSYPKSAMEQTVSENGEPIKRITHLTGDDVAVRAYILKRALHSVLTLVGAPEVMIQDVDMFFSDYPIGGGSSLAEKLQRKVNLDPSCLDNICALADDEDLEVHRTTIHALLKSGAIQRAQ